MVRRNGRRRGLVWWPSTLLVLVSCVAGAAPSHADSSLTRGTITTGEHFPNWVAVAGDQASIDQCTTNCSWWSAGTVVWADPVSGRVFEAGFGFDTPPGCPRQDPGAPIPKFEAAWAELDASGHLLMCRRDDPLPELNYATGVNAGTSFISAATVDSTDGLIFVPDSDGLGVAGAIFAVSEKTLGIVGSFCPDTLETPPVPLNNCTAPDASGSTVTSVPPQPHIAGMSWDATSDELVVVTDSRNSSFLVPSTRPTPAVVVVDYHVGVSTTGAVRLAQRWTYRVDPGACTRGLDTTLFTPPSAYLTSPNAPEQALYIPCLADPDMVGRTAEGFAQDVIVKEPMVPCGSGQTGMCPSGSLAIATKSPAPFAGFLFDPVSARAFLPISLNVKDTSRGVPVLVYDGEADPPVVSTRVTVGSPNSIANMAWAIDTVRGRLYAWDLNFGGFGLTLIDTRHTPVTATYTLPGVQPPAPPGGQELAGVYPVLPPDAGHPDPRVLVSVWTEESKVHPSEPQPSKRTRFITVLDDGIDVAQDLPAQAADAGKTEADGTAGAGATTVRAFGGSGGGYALHATLVSGYGAPIRYAGDQCPFCGPISFPTTAPGPTDLALGSLPRAEKTLDVLTSNVIGVSLDGGMTTGAASSIVDGNGQAAALYRQCTDAQYSATTAAIRQNCTTASDGLPVSQPGNDAQTAQQDWPAPLAECSAPGPAGQNTELGYYQMPVPHSADSGPTAVQAQQVAGTGDGDAVVGGQALPVQTNTEGAARADVDCLTGDGSQGYAWTGTVVPVVAGQAVPLNVGSGYAQAGVTPPANDALGTPVSSYVYADLRNLTVDLGGGNSIQIGAAMQRARAFAGGRRGTAGTERSVVLEDVNVSLNGQTFHYCASGGGEFGGVRPSCSTSDGIAQAVQAINALAPTHFQFISPQPAQPYGPPAAPGDPPVGSPVGYSAQVVANPAQQAGDESFNEMNSVEASYLPALRIVVYQDDAQQVAREVIDLAGVESDAHMGVHFVGGVPIDVPPTPPAPLDQQAQAAGLPTTIIQTIREQGPPTTTYVSSATGPIAVIQRIVAGFDWLKRRPAEALEMAGFLALLGVPLLLIARRRQWSKSLAEGV